MKIVEQKLNYDFQIKIGNSYVTVAKLQPWFISKYFRKYNLYFYYYGAEFEEGTYARNHFNGNVSITVWQQEDERFCDFMNRVKKIIRKKLYVIGNSILEDLKMGEDEYEID